MHKNGKLLFRKHTSSWTSNGDDNGDGDGDGEVANDESLKKNVNGDHIIQKNCLSITL